ncbi:ATP-NAD/AcoX kinase [Sulfurihydrogenibium sp. YO3AOP1]|uniref:NAD(+)/NADH kinase n=1 Tax=Sulfurihydrogenibium sp. (strain YO3AOP1) TaxID=436114 RepID=UPI00017259E5|nr:NAD(+)/NADH kinase [Sulfurihydrogenibium sp. YO3AOP1]ACD66724.1 ATP-NAD/AcoX kinase [Sulfurihydrogenibium sp. YO3AOP1]
MAILPFYKKVDIFTKQSEEAKEFSKELKAWFESKNIESNIFENLSDLEKEENLKGIDLLVVVGGDGSLLITARRVAKFQIPIIGINLGRLGFLTEISKDDAFKELETILSKPLCISKRMMLRVSLFREGNKILEADVLNDVVINKAVLARIVDVSVYVGDRYITTYNGDGVIVSTPNGSTAYALSAGGPIVYPMMEVFVLVPICPHTLTDRPIILPTLEPITIKMISKEKDAWLTLDGQEGTQIFYGDEIVVKQSPYYAHIVRTPYKNYFDILREKLNWK